MVFKNVQQVGITEVAGIMGRCSVLRLVFEEQDKGEVQAFVACRPNHLEAILKALSRCIPIQQEVVKVEAEPEDTEEHGSGI